MRRGAPGRRPRSGTAAACASPAARTRSGCSRPGGARPRPAPATGRRRRRARRGAASRDVEPLRRAPCRRPCTLRASRCPPAARPSPVSRSAAVETVRSPPPPAARGRRRRPRPRRAASITESFARHLGALDGDDRPDDAVVERHRGERVQHDQARRAERARRAVGVAREPGTSVQWRRTSVRGRGVGGLLDHERRAGEHSPSSTTVVSGSIASLQLVGAREQRARAVGGAQRRAPGRRRSAPGVVAVIVAGAA